MKVVEGVKGREGGPRRRCVWLSISRFPEPHLGSQGGPSRTPAAPWIFVVAEQRRWSCGREGGAAGSDDLASTEITSLFVLEILVHTSCLQRVSTRPVCLSESLLLPPPFALPPPPPSGSPPARTRQEEDRPPRRVSAPTSTKCPVETPLSWAPLFASCAAHRPAARLTWGLGGARLVPVIYYWKTRRPL